MIVTFTQPFSTLYAKLKDQPFNIYKSVRAEYRVLYMQRRALNSKDEVLDSLTHKKISQAFNTEWSVILKSLYSAYNYTVPRQTETEAKEVLKRNRPLPKNVKRSDWFN